ncbi:MAG: 50S ribosomal protein L10 [Chitinophagales bacterium]|nr:50S ribosomal protein L10 [Bacteroidota bacterium]MCB9042450.1 50S ribosomal protein L10 [Chitinophagales bacterium]
MTRAEKTAVIEALTEKFNAASTFYITDSSTLSVAQVNRLRRICFEKGVELKVAKNTIIRHALEKAEKNYEDLYEVLHGSSALMFCESGTTPAKLIKEFRKDAPKPALKAAYIEEAVFVGDDQLDALTKLKSKYELIGDVIGMLQSPAKNVISALQSGGGKLAGILKTLSEKE